jgi:hypothetical protein
MPTAIIDIYRSFSIERREPALQAEVAGAVAKRRPNH